MTESLDIEELKKLPEKEAIDKIRAHLIEIVWEDRKRLAGVYLDLSKEPQLKGILNYVKP